MPPAGMPRPDDDDARRSRLVARDRARRAAAARPNPGRTETFHRLNRAEYQNAVRDLLALDIDVAVLLPADDASYGFDNIAGVLKMSPSLMERYLSAARKISRVGGRRRTSRSGGADLSPCLAGAAAGRSGRGPAVRHARRHAHPPRLPAGRRIRVPLRSAPNAVQRRRARVHARRRRVKLFDAHGAAARRWTPTATSRTRTSKCGCRSRPARTTSPSRSSNDAARARRSEPAAVLEPDGEPARRTSALRSVTITGPFDATGAGDTPSRGDLHLPADDQPRSESGVREDAFSRRSPGAPSGVR